MSETIKIKVFRFNPTLEKKGNLVEYQLEKGPGMRVLGALKAINDQGQNIAFRYGCEEWECGSCAILANGKPQLACKTEIQNGMILEPLPDLPIARDLIVDRTKHFERQAELYKLPGKKTGNDLSFEDQERMWKSITCMECGICLASCPVLHPQAGSYHYIGPEFMVQLFRTTMDKRVDKKSLESSSKYGIWECTTCNYCEENCPQRIPILKQILELRSRIMEEQPTFVPETLRDLNTNLFRYHNAYGKPQNERLEWAAGLKVPDLSTGEKDILFFVGDDQCFNKRDQTVAKALVDIFRNAKINFGTLGMEEINAGEPALKTGEMGLFEELAKINIDNFKNSHVKKIVSTSPHDFHVFKREYPNLGGIFEVLHYTQFLDELVSTGKIKFSKKLDKKITYHDPCYLGRYEGIYDPPRRILQAIPGVKFVEMTMTREEAECCGGGGGGNWIDIPAGQRLSERRVMQAMETGANILAVACPYCLAMFEDAIKTKGYEGKMEVKHISELAKEAI